MTGPGKLYHLPPYGADQPAAVVTALEVDPHIKWAVIPAAMVFPPAFPKPIRNETLPSSNIALGLKPNPQIAKVQYTGEVSDRQAINLAPPPPQPVLWCFFVLLHNSGSSPPPFPLQHHQFYAVHCYNLRSEQYSPPPPSLPFLTSPPHASLFLNPPPPFQPGRRMFLQFFRTLTAGCSGGWGAADTLYAVVPFQPFQPSFPNTGTPVRPRLASCGLPAAVANAHIGVPPLHVPQVERS